MNKSKTYNDINCWRNRITDDFELSSKAKLIALILAQFFKPNSPTYPAIRTIAQYSSTTINTVQSAINELLWRGFVNKDRKRLKGSSFDSNIYSFMIDISTTDTSNDTSNDTSIDISTTDTKDKNNKNNKNKVNIAFVECLQVIEIAKKFDEYSPAYLFENKITNAVVIEMGGIKEISKAISNKSDLSYWKHDFEKTWKTYQQMGKTSNKASGNLKLGTGKYRQGDYGTEQIYVDNKIEKIKDTSLIKSLSLGNIVNEKR